MSSRATLVALAATTLAAGCGGSEDPEPEPPPPEPRIERTEHLPDLPARWQRYVNRRGGFAIGLPPGWKARDRGPGARVRSFDRLVAISIAPERDPGALAIAPREYAVRTAAALPGYEPAVDPGPPHPYRHRYDGAQVRAVAVARGSEVRQRLRVLALRRGELVTFAVVIAANAKPAAQPSAELAERVVATLRSRAPEGAQRSGRSG